MKKQLRNLLLLITPFLIMILINESVRPTIKEKPHRIFGVSTMNSKKPILDKCTWACYYNSIFCKKNHIKTFQPYTKFIDPIHDGIINSMKPTEKYSYAFANVFILAFLLPFLMFFLLIKIINLQSKINLLKSKS